MRAGLARIKSGQQCFADSSLDWQSPKCARLMQTVGAAGWRMHAQKLDSPGLGKNPLLHTHTSKGSGDAIRSADARSRACSSTSLQLTALMLPLSHVPITLAFTERLLTRSP
ncbi:hypothetical protein L1887_57896 [Cichorium endivia]|nr:hypothetical protein L1887_57896 [Cichorium endivia]